MIELSSDLIVHNSRRHYTACVIRETKLNESFNTNVPQDIQICLDFMVTILSYHCDGDKFADRRITHVISLKRVKLRTNV